jgi:hypothetical protein
VSRQPGKYGVLGLLAAGVVSLLAALIPVARGEQVNVVFFCTALVFLVLGAAVARRRRG